MIWLASFPRSGNTFFRNVLFEVYGIRSSTYHLETTYPVDEDYDQYQVVKTHLLPSQVKPNDPSIKSVYIVRDGRDALVSIAHHRKDLIESNSDFQINLLEAIVAPGDSHFGGWSENVRQWCEKADIIIRFEDLIVDPIKEIEKLRSIMDLPEPNQEKLPSFNSLKFGTPEYGSAKKYLADKNEQRIHSGKSFRKGKVGGWKEEMTPEIENLFWLIHKNTMEGMGYKRKGAPVSNRLNSRKKPYKILIEANKIFMPGNDGIKRYQIALLDNIITLQNVIPNRWDIDLFTDGIKSLSMKKENGESKSISELLKEHQIKTNDISDIEHTARPYEILLLQIKNIIKQTSPSFIYKPLSHIYRQLPLRSILLFIKKTIVRKIIKESEMNYDDYDLIHIPLPQNFHFLDNLKNNFLVTVHDLTHKLFPEHHTIDNIKRSEKGMQDVIRKKAKVLAISEATKNDLLNIYPEIKEKSISVIHEACDRGHFNPMHDSEKMQKLKNKYNLPDSPYFLTLSTLEPRKNLLNTIKAFNKLIERTKDQNLALFICGKRGWKIDELFKNENINNKNIFFTGFVDEDDLPALYSNALALCYISLYEGFGLPPLESMSCSTAVIYGNNSSMPEIIGDAGLAANPHDIDDITLKMESLLDINERTRLNQKSVHRAFQFSWLKTAWETLRYYEKCIDEN